MFTKKNSESDSGMVDREIDWGVQPKKRERKINWRGKEILLSIKPGSSSEMFDEECCCSEACWVDGATDTGHSSTPTEQEGKTRREIEERERERGKERKGERKEGGREKERKRGKILQALHNSDLFW